MGTDNPNRQTNFYNLIWPQTRESWSTSNQMFNQV